MPPRGLFITGTGTGVGKTYVTAQLIHALQAAGIRVGAYKPACSGSRVDAAGREVWDDLQTLSAALNDEFPLDRIGPQTFSAPLAPPAAARREDRTVDARLLREGATWWQDRVDVLLVEGAGGLLCPLTDEETVADLARDLGFPLLVVARLDLGTINHTLLTIEVARNRGLPLAGVILNEAAPAAGDLAAQTNPAELRRHCARYKVPLVGNVRYDGGSDVLELARAGGLDW